MGQEYSGLTLDAEQDWQAAINQLDDSARYVVKVDQAEKGRFKKGLVKLDRQRSDIAGDAQELFAKGYQYVLVEAYRPHEPAEERYLTVERTREGNKLAFSSFGGVDVESHAQDITSQLYQGQAIDGLDLPPATLDKLMQVFDDNYFSFLEINPYTVNDDTVQVLDAAVEVDDEAAFFEEGWQPEDIRSPGPLYF